MSKLDEAYKKVLKEDVSVNLDAIEEKIRKEKELFEQFLPEAEEFLDSRGFKFAEKSAAGDVAYEKIGKLMRVRILLSRSKADAGVAAYATVFMNKNYNTMNRIMIYNEFKDNVDAFTKEPGISSVKSAVAGAIGFLNDLAEDADKIEIQDMH